MDTDVLRWFKLVAEGATVTEVSELHAVTQSGVSRALARLEAQAGTPLLERSGRTLRLTRTGEVFKPHVDRLLGELRAGLDAVAQFVSPETGTVVVAFPQSLGSWLVPDLLGSFRAAHPGVGFLLTHARDELHGLPLDGGSTDMEIGTRRFRTGTEAVRPGDLAVRTQRIGVEPLRLALPSSHPLAARPPATRKPAARPLATRPLTTGPAGPGRPADPGGQGIGLAEVAAEPFIALRATSGLRKLGDDLCAAAGFRPKVVFEGDDLSNVRGLVAAGLGVAIVPAPRAGSPVAGPGPVRYLPILDDGAERDIYLTWPADKPLLPAAELFRGHVIDTVSSGRIRPVSGLAAFAVGGDQGHEQVVDDRRDPRRGDGLERHQQVMADQVKRHRQHGRGNRLQVDLAALVRAAEHLVRP
jgi:LysR family transcriptional regulator, transcription activator of glutamate synthase operon